MASDDKWSVRQAEYLEKRGSVSAVVGISEFQDAHCLDSIEDTTPGFFVWMCAAATAIGGMLFGYDTGVISGVLVVIGNSLNNKPLSDGEKELITTLCAAGALFGAIISGITADKFGRKPAIWFASILFTIGAIVQATSYTIAQMSVGRILIGLGVGSASMVGHHAWFHHIRSNNLQDSTALHSRDLSSPIPWPHDLR